jgi:hypothetical protein
MILETRLTGFVGQIMLNMPEELDDRRGKSGTYVDGGELAQFIEHKTQAKGLRSLLCGRLDRRCGVEPNNLHHLGAPSGR